MKVLFALLATTSFCYAASVGVSDEQLRGSHIISPPAHSVDMENQHVQVWHLIGSYIRKDGTPEGIEVSVGITDFPTKEACDEEVSTHQAGAKKSGVTLSCTQ